MRWLRGGALTAAGIVLGYLLGRLDQQPSAPPSRPSERDYHQGFHVGKAAGQVVERINAEELRHQTLREKEAARHLEEVIAAMHHQLLDEVWQQIENGVGVGPSTMLHVIKTTAKEAIATEAEMREQFVTGQPGSMTNVRATFANRLLPEPRNARGHGGIVTRRKRTGYAGDTAVIPSPNRYHPFDWIRDPSGRVCSVHGCLKPADAPIHDASLHEPPPEDAVIDQGEADAP